MRAGLGRLGCTVGELTRAEGCADADAIRRIVSQGEKDMPCHLCAKGRDNRHHWRYECEASADALLHVPLAMAAHLATAG